MTKVTLTVSTTSGAKPGEVVELDDREARTLVATGYATEVQDAPRVRTSKSKASDATAEDDEDTITKEG